MGAGENLEIHTRLTEAGNTHDVSRHIDFFHDDIDVQGRGRRVDDRDR